MLVNCTVASPLVIEYHCRPSAMLFQLPCDVAFDHLLDFLERSFIFASLAGHIDIATPDGVEHGLVFAVYLRNCKNKGYNTAMIQWAITGIKGVTSAHVYPL